MSFKKVSLVTAAGALAVMGAVTLASNTAVMSGGIPSVIADTPSVSAPGTTPSVASAVPAVKATKFAGGDWTGM